MSGQGVIRRQKKPKVNKGMIKRSSLDISSKPAHSSIQTRFFILALSLPLFLDRPISFEGDNDLIFGWWWISFVGFRGWKIYSTHGCVIDCRTNNMRSLLGYGRGRAARNMCLYSLHEPALIPTIMMPWAIQTFGPGLGQSRRREALLGMLPGQHHSSEIICSRR